MLSKGFVTHCLVNSIHRDMQISYRSFDSGLHKHRIANARSSLFALMVYFLLASPVQAVSPVDQETGRSAGAMKKEQLYTTEISLVDQPDESAAKLIFISDFETGAIQSKSADHDGWDIQSGRLPEANIVTDQLARKGVFSCRFTLRRSDWEGEGAPNIKPRAQLNKPARYLPIKQDTEYWMGVSMYIPSDGWDEEVNRENQTVFWQFHGTTSATGKSPPLVLHLIGTRLQIVNRWGDAKGPSWSSEVLWFQDGIEKNVWIDWVVRVNFSRKNTGFIQIWKDGVQIVNKQNSPTLYYTGIPDEKERVTIALSLYKSRFVKRFSSVDSLTMYYDEFRFAHGENGYNLVNPDR